ncbi:MAG: HPF/RaiA family ribosome-associated protein [Gammaproteobacteria bacterium]|nr:HPF/RaiA family ribosome-associated protein [Gammaproteobacteria bacterium]
MQIQVNTDKNIEGHEELVAQVEATITKSLSHFKTHITRVEVHLSDENGDKNSHNDKRCIMEARLEGRQPIAVTCQALTPAQAVAGAADKIKSALESTVGRRGEHR